MSSSERPSMAPEQLSFDDAGASRSRWIALALVLALVGWMLSGLVWPAEDTAPPADAQAAPPPVSVAVDASVAEPVEIVFTAEGQALPARDTGVRAQAAGEVERVLLSVGDTVTRGEEIARLAVDQREAALRRAEEELRRARRDFENAEALLERGATTEDQVLAARAALAAAEAQLADARQAIDDTILRAPFAGRLEELAIEEGEFVSAGESVARVVDLSPLTVEIRVPQRVLGKIEEGQRAEVSFITGETREGRVSFRGASADPETRTFRVEVEVPNEAAEIPAGISAEVAIPTGEEVAHFVSPATLSLGADGTLGIKTVDADDRVAFHEVEIVRARTDGMWVRGLPDEARIITVGQGFVTAGERVTPRDEATVTAPDAAGAAPAASVAEARE